MKHPKHRTFIIFVGVAIFEKKKKKFSEKIMFFFVCVFKFWRGSKMLWRPPKNNRCQWKQTKKIRYTYSSWALIDYGPIRIESAFCVFFLRFVSEKKNEIEIF